MGGEREKVLNILVVLGLIAVVAITGAEGINLWSDPDARWIVGRVYAIVAFFAWTSAPAFDVQGDPDLVFAKWLGVFKKWLGMVVLLSAILLGQFILLMVFVFAAPLKGVLLAAAPIFVTTLAGAFMGLRTDAYYPFRRMRSFLAPKSN